MSKKLAIFDFEKIIVTSISDLFLMPAVLPVVDGNKYFWREVQPLLERGKVLEVVERFYKEVSKQNLTENLLKEAKTLCPTPGIQEIFKKLKNNNFEIVIITTGCFEVVKSWLKNKNLDGLIREVIGRNLIKNKTGVPCFPNNFLCEVSQEKYRCPKGLCKGKALNCWLSTQGPHSNVLYFGNSVCLATYLQPSSYLFIKTGSTLERIHQSSSLQLPVETHIWSSTDSIKLIFRQLELFINQ